MDLGTILKLVHVFFAFWLTTGIIGRNITLAKAKNSTDIHAISAILSLSGIFDKRMVIPGSSAVVIAGLVTAGVQGWPILGFLQGGASSWVLAALLLYLTLIPVIVLIFVPRGKVFEGVLQNAIAQERVTPELTAAFHDPMVRAGRNYELVVLVLIVCLMVLKPF